jgi:hypothetical protein
VELTRQPPSTLSQDQRRSLFALTEDRGHGQAADAAWLWMLGAALLEIGARMGEIDVIYGKFAGLERDPFARGSDRRSHNKRCSQQPERPGLVVFVVRRRTFQPTIGVLGAGERAMDEGEERI